MAGRRFYAIRGATTVDRDAPNDIRGATRELLEAILAANQLSTAEIVSALFTVTDDLCSDFPARAARELGWTEVALMCMTEIAVPGALPRCIRVMIHVEVDRPAMLPRHQFLRGAHVLRPDWVSGGRADGEGEGEALT